MTGENGWFYDDGAAERGPLERATLAQMKEAGLITGETRVRSVAGGAWRTLEDALAGIEPAPPSADAAIPTVESVVPPGPMLPPLPKYYVAGAGGQPIGPCTVLQLADMVARGELVAATLVARDGGEAWVPVESVIGPARPAATLPAEVIHRDPTKVAVLTCITLGIYWLCYIVPCYTRDMAAITRKPRLDFTLAVIMGVLGWLLPMAMGFVMSLWAGEQKFVWVLVGLPTVILACMYAFELEKIGRKRHTPGARESLGWLFLGLTAAGVPLTFAPETVGILLGLALGVFQIFILQREFNLYAEVPA